MNLLELIEIISGPRTVSVNDQHLNGLVIVGAKYLEKQTELEYHLQFYYIKVYNDCL